MKSGFLYIPERKKWAPFQYKEGVLTIYTANNIDTDRIKKVPILDFKSPYKYLVGIDVGGNNTIVFFVESMPEGKPWSSSSRRVYFHFSLDEKNHHFTGISFHCKELEYFYDSFYALDIAFKNKSSKISITPKNHDETVKSFDFVYKNIAIDGSIVISNRLAHHSPVPLKVKTYIRLTFPETNDIEFIMDLYMVTFRFVCFIANRKNIEFDDIKLHQRCFIPDRKEEYIGSIPLIMYNDKTEIIENVKALEKTLSYSFLKNHLSAVWQFIAENKLYIEHVPENSFDRSYTIARMILIVAAFEWNANKFLKPSATSAIRSDVKNDILHTLDSLSTTYNSKKRSYLKSFIKQIELYDVSLSNKVVYALQKYENILLPFITMIYALNEEPLIEDYKEKIGERVQLHRNAFAHGNIDMEIDLNIILDLHILQWAIYCMILEAMGFDKIEIKKIIHYFRDGNVHLASSISERYDNEV